ncbi:MAG: peptidyl-alpha-hydroxyglycine alpha-amidating lyase family protein [Pseudohongiella sp.]|nr:peptidyl-alpha-hydroxyglycine alpha-amidating lyase family protein [Pseudohongiella sp.]
MNYILYLDSLTRGDKFGPPIVDEVYFLKDNTIEMQEILKDDGASRNFYGRWKMLMSLTVSLLVATPVNSLAQQTLNWQADSTWADLRGSRTWGSVTGVHPDPDGEHIWVLDRCGANTCIGSSLAPVFKFDLQGNIVSNFGAGLIAWPHGLFVDHEGNVWVTDGGTGAAGEEAANLGMGHQVIKFSPNGEILMRLGQAGIAGSDTETFNGPSVVVVASNGDIFIADGHGEGGNNRIMKFSSSGHYIKEWGSSGPGPGAGEFSDVHALAFDSQGRLFVGDRRNSRIQIFDQEGNFLEQWAQFGPPSDIFIDADDVIYVTDTQTNAMPQWFRDRRPNLWIRGIRVGDARTGNITGFLRSDAEFLTVDKLGNIYGAEVPGQKLTKYSKP